MLKFLVGPVLVAGGYLAGSVYGRDAEQAVHKSPSITYAAIEQALNNVRPNGTTFFDGGTPIPYELRIDRSLDQHLLVTLLFDGKEGAEADVTFTPQNDGRDTLIAARIHGDRAVLRTALAGTSKARLAYAPDWMLNLSLKPVLQQLAAEIEKGQAASFDALSSADAQAQWESNLSTDQREQVSQWQQYQATRPTTDPDADARNYASGSGGN
jgi:hypothetical protein